MAQGLSLGRALRIGRGAVTVTAVGLLGTSILQCSAGSGGTGAGNGANGGGSAASSNGGSGNVSTGGGNWDSGGLDVVTKDVIVDVIPPDDPPPTSCDGGGNWTWPGGTPECPADKNYEFCPCTTEGETAACWPGLRKHRNRGDCKDGVTTCGRQGEISLEWGPCVGYKGIDPANYLPYGTTGKAACSCFSGGFWKIDNTSPCFFFSDAAYTKSIGAISTLKSTGQCPNVANDYWNNPTTPSDPWSGNTVTADCTGYFKLCFTIKAFSKPNGPPAAGDCTIKQVCTEASYAVANQVQTFPDLPGWVTATTAERSCAQTFVTNGGYAEMSVVGESDECDKVDKVFQTVTYCAFKCNQEPAKSTDPDCINCQPGGGGQF
jgi:hypothetical protein